MNILILSVGTRNKLVQYFRTELSGIGKVFATDCSPYAPALYEADDYFIVPRITDDSYLEHILELCQTHNITAVFSLIDPELTLLAENRHRFEALGTLPIISPPDAVELAFNKYKFFHFCQSQQLPTIRTYLTPQAFYQEYDQGLINFPVFVKPINGSASLNINKVLSKEALDVLCQQHPELLIQEFMAGQEIGVDVYVDFLSHQVVSIFSKEKLSMRAGETDKSRSFIDPKLFKLIERFLRETNFVGMIDFDIFRTATGDYIISEVNPRFGGGYLHAFEAGVSFPRFLINNLQGKINRPVIGHYPENTYMMKFNDLIFNDAFQTKSSPTKTYVITLNSETLTPLAEYKQ